MGNFATHLGIFTTSVWQFCYQNGHFATLEFADFGHFATLE